MNFTKDKQPSAEAASEVVVAARGVNSEKLSLLERTKLLGRGSFAIVSGGFLTAIYTGLAALPWASPEPVSKPLAVYVSFIGSAGVAGSVAIMAMGVEDIKGGIKGKTPEFRKPPQKDLRLTV